MWHNQNCFKSSLYTLCKGVKVSRYDFIIIQMSFEDIKTIVHGHECRVLQWTTNKSQKLIQYSSLLYMYVLFNYMYSISWSRFDYTFLFFGSAKKLDEKSLSVIDCWTGFCEANDLRSMAVSRQFLIANLYLQTWKWYFCKKGMTNDL